MRRSSVAALRWAVAVAALVALAACSGSSGARPPAATETSLPAASPSLPAASPSLRAASPCGRSPGSPPEAYDHVVWIWFENHTGGQVIGNSATPYTSALAAGCGTAGRYASVGSPSLPNYIGATSGDIHGIHDDANPSAHPLDADNIFRQVRASGRAERSYEESMPGTCATRASGLYAVKHNPAAYFVGGTDRQACAADDIPLGSPQSGALADALRLDALPAFSFITPNLCNDTHDCKVGTGDAWLANWLPRLVDSAAYRAGRTAIFIAWDEPTPMPFIVVAPSVMSGTKVDAPVDHYSLLRTTQELLGLTPLLGAAATATSLRAPFAL